MTKADWRRITGWTLGEDLHPHKAGVDVVPLSYFVHERHGVVAFTKPHPSALTLNASMRNGVEARQLWKRIQKGLERRRLFRSTGLTVNAKHVPLLFDYFERCMGCVVFAFAAVESFANGVISDIREDITVKRNKGRTTKTFTADEAPRELGTEEKLAVVLPELLRLDSPKGKAVWENFVRLKRSRDNIIHLKGYDVTLLTREGSDQDGDNSMLLQFFDELPLEHIPAAVAMIEYFSTDLSWLNEFKAKLKMNDIPG